MSRWSVKPPVERVRHGYRINLQPDERELVRRLLGELQGLLVGPSDNPALKRIFPAAYHLAEHAEHDAEYQRLMREELVASRLTAISAVSEALEAKPPLDESQILALMQSLNGLRLVIGTMLDVHYKGRAVVSSGSREKSELDVFRLHENGLWATMQQDD